MNSRFTLHHGDCLDVMRGMPDASVDSIVTDPPYGLSFMGKHWDYDVPGVDVWAECLRVLKPGGHLLAFAGTRTQHRMAVRIEDAGFEIRDMIAWVYGSGFPKSLDVSKAIDKSAGVEREVVGLKDNKGRVKAEGWGLAQSEGDPITTPATQAARQWQGWGTALKPALEPITVARKPLVGTVAANVLEHGTGALNIDGCRVATDDDLNGGAYSAERKPTDSDWVKHGGTIHSSTGNGYVRPSGRWPANLIHDGSEEVLAGFPQANHKTGGPARTSIGGNGAYSGGDARVPVGYDDTGSAARFFYCAKSSRADRNEGCDHMARKPLHWSSGDKNPGSFQSEGTDKTSQNHHPTVKPTDLMAYLCRLVTPPGGIVLDPFMGSGSTGKAAMREGFRFIGIELSDEYLSIARARIEHAANDNKPKTGDLFREAS